VGGKGGSGGRGRNDPSLYAHMNNKRKKKRNPFVQLIHCDKKKKCPKTW
jgi:hypothetical protein